MSDWKNVQYKDGKMRTSEGGGGGSSTFAGLDDVSFNNIQNGQVPKYNSTTQKWENANESGGGGGLTQTVIYTGNDQPTYYYLTQPLTNFDAIAVYVMTSNWYTSNIFLVSELMDKAGVDARFGTFSNSVYIYFKVIDANTLQRSDTQSFLIYKIIGLKF